jgi:2-polyprenyl-6-methoxyphenol hydroxylase-like FAD-dependent oxidoreductase
MPVCAVIVGGGIAGLAAAAALQRRSWQVTVLERGTSLSEVGAGITLWPNALRALDALDVGARIRDLGLVQSSGGMRDSRGRWLKGTDTEALAERFGDGIVVLERKQLLTALRDACTEVDICVSHGVRTVDPNGAVLVDSTGSARERVEGDVVIGADGVWSAVRTALWPEARVRSTGMVAARLIGRVPYASGAPGGETWGRGDYAGIAPLPDGRLYAYLVVPVTAGAPSEPEEALRWWRQRFAAWHPPLPQLLADVEPSHLLRNELYDLAPLPSLASGRVALVGDAAHAITPNLGQGACQALEDAVELGACLGSGTAVAGEVTQALRTYAARRLPRVHRLARRSRAAGAIAALRGPVSTTVRNTLVTMVPAAMSLRALDAAVGWDPPTT